MRIAVISIILLFSNFAGAFDFAGTWKGVGLYEATIWGSFKAHDVNVEIIQNDHILSIKDCWAFLKDGSNWRICSANDFEISGFDILIMGEKVGSFTKNRLVINYNYGGTLIEFNIFKNPDGGLNYLYQALESSSGELIKAKADGLIFLK
jgi:hypothetical protein